MKTNNRLLNAVHEAFERASKAKKARQVQLEILKEEWKDLQDRVSKYWIELEMPPVDITVNTVQLTLSCDGIANLDKFGSEVPSQGIFDTTAEYIADILVNYAESVEEE